MSTVKYRPRARWFIAPAVLFFVVAPAFAVPGLIRFFDVMKDDAIVAADGNDHSVTLDEPGDRMLFGDPYRSAQPPECRVSTPAGEQALETPFGTFTVNQWRGFAVVRTSATRIVVNCRSDQDGVEVRIGRAIGGSDFLAGFASFGATLLVGGGAVVWAMVLFALTLSRPKRPV